MECESFRSGSGYRVEFKSVSLFFHVMLFFHSSIECISAIIKLAYTIGYISMDMVKEVLGVKVMSSKSILKYLLPFRFVVFYHSH